MFRSQINDEAVIKAVNDAIYDKAKRPDDICIKPAYPEYPEQVWIELHHVLGLSYTEINRLQNTLYRRNLFSISVYYGRNYHNDTVFLQICLSAAELRTKYLRNEES